MLDLFTEIKARLHLVGYLYGGGLTFINLRSTTVYVYTSSSAEVIQSHSLDDHPFTRTFAESNVADVGHQLIAYSVVCCCIR